MRENKIIGNRIIISAVVTMNRGCGRGMQDRYQEYAWWNELREMSRCGDWRQDMARGEDWGDVYT